MYPLNSVNNDKCQGTFISTESEEDDTKIPLDLAASTVKDLMSEVLPQKLDLLSQHNRNLQQACNSCDHSRANQEIVKASLLVKQIERELGNLDKLKQRLKEPDHPAFDKLVNEPVKKASKILQNFYELKAHQRLIVRTNKEEEKEISVDSSLPQLQVLDYQTELEEAEAYTQSVEKVQKECEYIHETFTILSKYVADSAEKVEKVEELTIVAEENVQQAERSLAYCARKNLALYPLIGAAVGACVGGPVGLLVGAKVAVAAALGGGVLGIQGAKAIKRKKLEDLKAIDERVKENNSS